MDDTRVALAQIICPFGKLTDNVEKHRRYAKRTAEEGGTQRPRQHLVGDGPASGVYNHGLPKNRGEK